MKNFTLLFITSIFISCSSKVTKHIIDVDRDQMMMDVKVLASDDMEGREVGTAGERKAADYIASRFRSLALNYGHEESFFHPFVKIVKANPHSTARSADDETINGLNVVGKLNNGAGKVIVIGGHYDHLGYGGQGSLSAGIHAIHNGADDNASGIAMMLALAEMLVKNEIIEQHDFIFIGFSGEEKGLWGSNAYAKDYEEMISQGSFMINMDMVGRLNKERDLAINGTGTSPVFSKALRDCNSFDFDLIMSESGVGPSDHTSFYLQDMPALHIFTGQHEDYHKPSDDFEKVNFEGMYDITSYLYDLVMRLDAIGDLPFTKTKDESRSNPKFKVTLGVVPDYLFSGAGMRIDGVTEGKPAHIAGILKGDIVVKLGDIEVTDMMTYMKALSKFEKGDETQAVVLRKDKSLQKKIIFF